MYLRQNIVQAVIGEILGVSQPTVSRAIKAITAAISRTLAVLLLTAEEVPRDCDYVVDGTLFPCLDWRKRRDLWSVKHGSAGMNVQILVRLNGEFMWASDPYPGSMNRSVNRIRQVVERTIAHIKSWRILHTPYRRPLETFEQTITAALALYSFKTTP